MSIRKTGFALTLLAALSAASLVDAEGAQPDFSGSWELNEERSDDADEKAKEARRTAVDPGSGSTRGGYGRRLPPGATPRDTESEGERRSWLSLLSGYREAVRILRIDHAEPELRITSAMPGSAIAQTVYTDKRSFERPGSGEGNAAEASWQRGGRLLVELETPDGRAIRETWELVAEGARLLITAKLEGGRLLPDVSYQRVYDRVEIVPWDVPE